MPYLHQNVNAAPTTAPEVIQEHSIQQLTAPVRWNQTIQRMIKDGTQRFVAYRPGKVLQELVKKDWQAYLDGSLQVLGLLINNFGSRHST